MGKALVALLTLLVAAVPAAAQDPESESASQPSSGEPTGEADLQAESQAQQQQAEATTCRLTEFHVGDPHTPPSHWFIFDPDGCIRETVRKIVRELPPL